MNAIDRERLLKWLKSLDSTYVRNEIIPQIESGAFDAEPNGEVQRLRASLGHIHAIAQSELDELQYESQRKTWEEILLTAEEALKGDENA